MNDILNKFINAFVKVESSYDFAGQIIFIGGRNFMFACLGKFIFFKFLAKIRHSKVGKPIKKTVVNIFLTICHRNLGSTIISLQIISNVVYYGP